MGPFESSDQRATELSSAGSGESRSRASPLDDFLGLSGLFVLAEILILGRSGDLGLLVHVFGMLLLFFMIYRTRDESALLYQSMLLIPLLRIFNFGIPLFTGSSLVIITVLYLFLLFSGIQILRSQRLSIGDIGMTSNGLPFGAIGILVGLIFGFVQYGFALEGFAYDPTLTNFALVIVSTGVLVSFVEELIFRGLIQRWAEELYGTWIAILTTSIVFGFMHSVWLHPPDILFAGLTSVFLGLVYSRSNNLWFVVFMHGAINVAAFLIYPLLIPNLNGQLVNVISGVVN